MQRRSAKSAAAIPGRSSEKTDDEGASPPSSFHCGVGEEEKYRDKDLEWIHLFPEYGCDETHLEKFKRDIKSLQTEHEYPLPDQLKESWKCGRLRSAAVFFKSLR